MSQAPVKTRTGRRPKLTRLQIVDTAAQLLEQDGSGFGMRRLAAELGVSATALYNYFPNQGELMRAVLQQREGAQFPVLDGASDRPLRDQLLSLSLQWRDYLEHHARLVASGGSPFWNMGDSSQMLAGILDYHHENLRVLVGTGLSAEQADRLMNSLMYLAFGSGQRSAQAAGPADEHRAALTQLDWSNWPLFEQLSHRPYDEQSERERFTELVLYLVDMALPAAGAGA